MKKRLNEKILRRLVQQRILLESADSRLEYGDEEIYDFKRPVWHTYIDGLLKAAASKDYRVGDWKKWAEARRGFPLSYIPSFWDYLDIETQRNKQ